MRPPLQLGAFPLYYESEQRCHKKLTDWARQIVFQLRRWLPNRDLVVVADYSYAVLEFLATCQKLSNPVTIITRLRLDAAPSQVTLSES